MPLSYVTTAIDSENKIIYWNLFKGEVVPISYTFPDSVDLEGDSFHVNIDGNDYPMTKTDQTVKAIIPSTATAALSTGKHLVNIWHTMPDTNRQVIISGEMNVK